MPRKGAKVGTQEKAIGRGMVEQDGRAVEEIESATAALLIIRSSWTV